MTTVLHLAPHADDELIGAPATLMALRDGGRRVVNFLSSLGTPDQAGRRRAEAEEACRRAGFDLVVARRPLGDPLAADQVAEARSSLQEELEALILELRPEIVISPSPHDRHRGHEVVGRTAIALFEALRPDAALWLWGLWADLPFPNLAVPFDKVRLREILKALEAHEGELERNDYSRVVRGRAEMNASLGPERVFGFGSAARETDYVELLIALGYSDDRWLLKQPRWLGEQNPAHDSELTDVSDWLRAPSITDLYGLPTGS